VKLTHHFKELQVLGAANTLQKRTAEAAIQTANKLTREVRLPPKKISELGQIESRN
jgi:hypothetical protein